jgi:muramoyltetrapeptide carboxypeptidase
MLKSRRTFLEEVSFASLIAGFPASARAALSSYAENPPAPLVPKALRKGDTVALIRPASPSYEYEANEVAADVVRSFGLVPKLMPNAGRKTHYLAGTDAERTADLNSAFADPGVAAVWCVTGGYGTSRIVPYLDYETIRRNPKPFIGYSDITATLNAINRFTGLVTFHGPIALGMSEYSAAAFRKVVMEGYSGRIAEPPPAAPREGAADDEHRVFRLAPGKATGRLAGGNISVFSTLVGTPFEPELKGRILFLEEVGEDPYRIDRWLTQFLLSGKLSGVAGVALGTFSKCAPGDFKPSYSGLGTWTWEEVCADRLGRLGIPVLAGLCFGHVPDNATLPVGAMAELDADAGTLTLLEPAVR